MTDPVSSNDSSTGAPTLQILLVEDNPVNQKLGSIMLERLGHVVTVAGNGQEACDISAQRSFDLILMDIEMPVMNGEQAVQRIRAREQSKGGHTTIIALTANAMRGDREKYLSMDMDGYLAKPFKLEELRALLLSLKLPR